MGVLLSGKIPDSKTLFFLILKRFYIVNVEPYYIYVHFTSCEIVCYHQIISKLVSANFQERMWLNQKIIFRINTFFAQSIFKSQAPSHTHTFSLSLFLSLSMLTLSWTGQLIRSSRARRVWSDIIFFSIK
jgi:hypothetical protein